MSSSQTYDLNNPRNTKFRFLNQVLTTLLVQNESCCWGVLMFDSAPRDLTLLLRMAICKNPNNTDFVNNIHVDNWIKSEVEKEIQ